MLYGFNSGAIGASHASRPERDDEGYRPTLPVRGPGALRHSLIISTAVEAPRRTAAATMRSSFTGQQCKPAVRGRELAIEVGLHHRPSAQFARKGSSHRSRRPLDPFRRANAFGCCRSKPDNGSDEGQKPLRCSDDDRVDLRLAIAPATHHRDHIGENVLIAVPAETR